MSSTTGIKLIFIVLRIPNDNLCTKPKISRIIVCTETSSNFVYLEKWRCMIASEEIALNCNLSAVSRCSLSSFNSASANLWHVILTFPSYASFMTSTLVPLLPSCCSYHLSHIPQALGFHYSSYPTLQ